MQRYMQRSAEIELRECQTCLGSLFRRMPFVSCRITFHSIIAIKPDSISHWVLICGGAGKWRGAGASLNYFGFSLVCLLIKMMKTKNEKGEEHSVCSDTNGKGGLYNHLIPK